MSKQASRANVLLASQERADAGDQVQKLYTLAQWQLIWRKFIRNKVAIIGGIVILLYYLGGLFAG